MKTKKLLSVALSLTMAFSLAATAFAAGETQNAAVLDNGTYGASIDFTGKLNVPTIAVTIPAAGDVFVNPYKLEAEINTATSPATTQDGVFSAIYAIESKTAVKLDIGVYGTISPNGDVVVKDAKLTEGTADAPTDKEVFVYLQVAADGSGNSADGYSGTFADDPAAVTAETDGVLILTEDTDEIAKDLGDLPAFTNAQDDDGDAFVEGTDTVGVATFRFGGMSQPYTTEPWNEDDNVTANVVFNFTPTVQTVAP